MKWLLLFLPFVFATPCSELMALDTEAEAMERVSEITGADIKEQCILDAIQNNWWEFGVKLTSLSRDNKVELTEAVRKSVVAQRKKVEKLVTAFESRPTVQTVSPAL
jgi:hypothetical protein